ncbi:hypothetical protein K788_00036780 (plasmid) [Paraburkholderia caribensis MBA4]|uniref:Transmembrane protein n=1 Tax=Paraburkholderia caribensis MBA4 TaxID=1323664 RepID=A0A0N7JWD3_9BURK|nr:MULTISPECIES: hypothetical protein [Paraburkholderia]ALL71693.1 hypothetical protein K788_00036780 [Paraburkholderia caribensis MBA4]MDW3662559.1 hypothetical protein [Paraburkholderia terrae]
MGEFIDFVKAWAKLISGVFADAPLAGAVVTLITVALFFAYERHNKSADWTIFTFRFFIALMAWAIAVPVLGFVFSIIKGVWDGAQAVRSAVWEFLLFLYRFYDSHFIIFLAILLVVVLAHVAWHLLRPEEPPGLYKAIVGIAAFSFCAAVGKPIADFFAPVPSGQPKVAAPAPFASSATAASTPTASVSRATQLPATVHPSAATAPRAISQPEGVPPGEASQTSIPSAEKVNSPVSGQK